MPVLNQLKLPLLTALGESQVEENRPGYLGDRPRALGRYSRLGTVAGQSFRYTSNKTSLSGPWAKKLLDIQRKLETG
jgi:hypothetical protein